MALSNRAQNFFDVHVRPAVDEWNRAPADMRKAMDAAVELNQMADYFFHEYSVSDPGRVFSTSNLAALRAELGRRFPDFAILRDVAEAHKHVKIQRSGRYVTSAGQTLSISVGLGSAELGEDELGGSKSIIVQLDNAQTMRLKHLIVSAVKMWESLL